MAEEMKRYPMTRTECECRGTLFDAALDHSVEIYDGDIDAWWGVYEGARHLEEMIEERLIING